MSAKGKIQLGSTRAQFTFASFLQCTLHTTRTEPILTSINLYGPITSLTFSAAHIGFIRVTALILASRIGVATFSKRGGAAVIVAIGFQGRRRRRAARILTILFDLGRVSFSCYDARLLFGHRLRGLLRRLAAFILAFTACKRDFGIRYPAADIPTSFLARHGTARVIVVPRF